MLSSIACFTLLTRHLTSPHERSWLEQQSLKKIFSTQANPPIAAIIIFHELHNPNDVSELFRILPHATPMQTNPERITFWSARFSISLDLNRVLAPYTFHSALNSTLAQTITIFGWFGLRNRQQLLIKHGLWSPVKISKGRPLVNVALATPHTLHHSRAGRTRPSGACTRRGAPRPTSCPCLWNVEIINLIIFLHLNEFS